MPRGIASTHHWSQCVFWPPGTAALESVAMKNGVDWTHLTSQSQVSAMMMSPFAHCTLTSLSLPNHVFMSVINNTPRKPSVIGTYVFSHWLFQPKSIWWGRLNNTKDNHRLLELSLMTISVILDTFYNDNYLLIFISCMVDQFYRLIFISSDVS